MDSNATGSCEQQIHGQLEMDSEGVSAIEFASPRISYGLVDVLLPATPPVPKNARIIRLFDLEAAKYDPCPASVPDADATAAAAPTSAPEPAPASTAAPKEPTRRSALREERRSSLAAAAGLLW